MNILSFQKWAHNSKFWTAKELVTLRVDRHGCYDSPVLSLFAAYHAWVAAQVDGNTLDDYIEIWSGSLTDQEIEKVRAAWDATLPE